MSAWEADADALIAAGWGSHSRHQIPDDWQTNRGPDEAWKHNRQAAGRKPKRQTWRERRALYEAARDNAQAAGD